MRLIARLIARLPTPIHAWPYWRCSTPSCKTSTPTLKVALIYTGERLNFRSVSCPCAARLSPIAAWPAGVKRRSLAKATNNLSSRQPTSSAAQLKATPANSQKREKRLSSPCCNSTRCRRSWSIIFLSIAKPAAQLNTTPANSQRREKRPNKSAVIIGRYVASVTSLR